MQTTHCIPIDQPLFRSTMDALSKIVFYTVLSLPTNPATCGQCRNLATIVRRPTPIKSRNVEVHSSSRMIFFLHYIPKILSDPIKDNGKVNSPGCIQKSAPARFLEQFIIET
jgi:hypothetical protein